MVQSVWMGVEQCVTLWLNSLSLSLSLTHTHTHTHTRAQTISKQFTIPDGNERVHSPVDYERGQGVTTPVAGEVSTMVRWWLAMGMGANTIFPSTKTGDR